MTGKAIVLDANILIRAVLGKRVRELIFGHSQTVKFFAPDIAYADARKYLPALLKKRGVDATAAMLVLDCLESIVQSIDAELYDGMSLSEILCVRHNIPPKEFSCLAISTKPR